MPIALVFAFCQLHWYLPISFVFGSLPIALVFGHFYLLSSLKIYITMIIPTTMSINTITILSAQVSKDKSQISNETCQMSTPLTMSINTILIAQVRNAGLVLSTGSDFRTIVARNFSQGRKVFVAI